MNAQRIQEKSWIWRFYFRLIHFCEAEEDHRQSIYYLNEAYSLATELEDTNAQVLGLFPQLFLT